MNEFEKLVPVINGDTVVTVTLSNSAEYPPAYRPKPVAVPTLSDGNVPATEHVPIPAADAQPVALFPCVVKLNVYHVS